LGEKIKMEVTKEQEQELLRIKKWGENWNAKNREKRKK